MLENEKEIEIDESTPEYKAGYSAGAIIAYVVAGCGCALLIGMTLKILQWMLF